MNYLKNTLAIVALLVVISANAKQMGAKTAQPIIQPQPQPIIQPRPMPIIQPQLETPTYTEILSALKRKQPDSSDLQTLKNIAYEIENQIEQIRAKKRPAVQPMQFVDLTTYSGILSALKNRTPDSSDFSTLNNIKNEAETQINAITKSVTKKSQPSMKDMENYAKQLVNKYYEPFTIDQKRIENAIATNSDIFPENVAKQQLQNIDAIVKEFVQKYPNAEKIDATQIIWGAICRTSSLQKLGAELPLDRSSRILLDIREAIENAWDKYKK